MKYNHLDIKEILPYDYPFLMLDSIEEMSKDKIIAKKNLTSNEFFFKGHFRDFPIMPGVLILEAIGQAGSFFIRKKAKVKDIDVLAYKIENASFISPALPGDTLKIEVTLEELKKNVWNAKGKVLVGDKMLCDGMFHLYVAKKKEFREKCLLRE